MSSPSCKITEKANYTLMSCHRNAGESKDKLIYSFKMVQNVYMLKRLQEIKNILEATDNRFNSDNVCYHLV